MVASSDGMRTPPRPSRAGTPQGGDFTIRRGLDRAREEHDLIEQLRWPHLPLPTWTPLVLYHCMCDTSHMVFPRSNTCSTTCKVHSRKYSGGRGPILGVDSALTQCGRIHLIAPTRLFRVIESRLKVQLPAEIGPSLVDGVVLCHLANQVQPRSVASIHVPSAATRDSPSSNLAPRPAAPGKSKRTASKSFKVSRRFLIGSVRHVTVRGSGLVSRAVALSNRRKGRLLAALTALRSRFRVFSTRRGVV
ncbi:hypothetical protein HPB49_015914 [Dermacentor silvarum]|uniref:Uncharacterized protein n=1 Tax=Dermacentor silvarum TaxID=543639 RepID=A0ACB8DEF5_DERSI|nr:hypothetical protein HPB49_015914 [Dermacentor silvarum]